MREKNSQYRRETGTRGWGVPEVTSQRMEDFCKGRETTERDGLDTMDWTEVHSDCRAGREEKSKSVVDRSRETAETTGRAEGEAGTGLKGREKASATTFSEPGTWTISLGNSGDVGKMACLSGRPRRRGPEKGMGERLMICEKGKLVGFQRESEMAD